MAVDYDKENSKALTAKDIAHAVSQALEAQRKAEMGQGWDQKHGQHHDKLDQLLPYIDDLVSYIEVVKKREERHQKIYEKVTGTLLVSGILAFLGYVGKLFLGSLGD